MEILGLPPYPTEVTEVETHWPVERGDVVWFGA